jgi:tyrosinase
MMLFLLLLIPLFIATASISAITTRPQPAVRKEWISLNTTEKEEYINAVLCLYYKASKLPEGQVPGAINRRDDFTAVHINQTFGVHLNAVFLGWHRNFLNLYETALREECGYKG